MSYEIENSLLSNQLVCHEDLKDFEVSESRKSLVRRVSDLDTGEQLHIAKRVKGPLVKTQKKMDQLEKLGEKTLLKVIAINELGSALHSDLLHRKLNVSVIQTVYDTNPQAYEIMTSRLPIMLKLDYDGRFVYPQRSYDVYGKNHRDLTNNQKAFLHFQPILRQVPVWTDHGHILQTPLDKDSSFENFKKVRLEGEQIRITDLHVLLYLCKDLKDLYIANCPLLRALAFTSLEENSLPHLTSLSLSNMNQICVSDLLAIAKAAPNLKKLHMTHCETILKGELSLLHTKCMSQVKELSVKNINLTSRSLRSLLRMARNIKSLEINNCRVNYTKYFTPPSRNLLPNLERMIISTKGFQIKDFQNLAQSAQNLHTLIYNLKKYDFPKDYSQLPPNSFLQIKELHVIAKQYFKIENLFHMATAMPNIENLLVHKLKDTAEIELETMSQTSIFPKLKSLSLIQCEMSDSKLVQLILSAPELKQVSFVSCPYPSQNDIENLKKNNPKISSIQFSW